jgi:hypothetical protein
MVHTPGVLQTQLSGALSVILSEDHPHKWTSFVTDLLPFITSSEAISINVGLVGLRELVKVYRYQYQNNYFPFVIFYVDGKLSLIAPR